MKSDECSLIAGAPVSVHPKRLAWIAKKWQRKGWWDGNLLTPEGVRVSYLVSKVDLNVLDGRVAVFYFRNGPPMMGIAEDYSDNGWYLHTAKGIRRRYDGSWWLDENEIAYAELHPSPNKLWRKLNYLFWKYHGVPDRFHRKVTAFGRVVHGYKGELGECLPWCGCKFLAP